MLFAAAAKDAYTAISDVTAESRGGLQQFLTPISQSQSSASSSSRTASPILLPSSFPGERAKNDAWMYRAGF